MRPVIAGLFISLDGVTQDPHLWQFDVFDEDMGVWMTEYIDDVGDILLGRVTYQEWANYWPVVPIEGDDAIYANHINSTPKHVVSTTLDSVKWGDYDTVSLIRDDLAGAIGDLKSKPGKPISTAGSPTLVRSLLEQDLLDELTLMIHPVIVGTGKSIYDDWGDLKRLSLADSKVTGSGVVFLTYRRRAD